MEKEEKENIWRMKFILAEEKKENCCGRTGRTGGRESKALQEVLADLKIFSNKLYDITVAEPRVCKQNLLRHDHS